jgi:hypothetical protein
MQMGRWFGYRDGYHDLCRIYLTSMTEAYFSHIAEATEELRDEIKEMFKKGRTPKDFGLKVRTHPGSLLITAKNKMRTGITVKRKIDFKGRLIESDKLDLRPNNRQHNWNLLINFIKNISNKISAESTKNHLFKNVPIQYIIDFVTDFNNYQYAHMTDTLPLVSYLENAQNVFPSWDVVLVGTNDKTSQVESIAGLTVNVQKRKVTSDRYSKNDYIEITSRRRVGTTSNEKVGMSDLEIELAVEDYMSNNKDSIPSRVSGVYLRKYRTRPLLMLHVINSYKDIKDNSTLVEKNLFAYGISFPCKGPDIKEVEFMVNTTYVKNQYNGYEDDEE